MSKASKILILGGSGFIGSALGEEFSSMGYHLNVLSRYDKNHFLSYPCHLFKWDGLSIPQKSIEDVDVVINLVGASVADHFWTKSYRKKIISSRLQSTEAIVKAFALLQKKPKLIIQASAVGYYGMGKKSNVCDEDSKAGDDFLSEVCQKWEKSIQKLKGQSRVCIARIGLVLGWTGGAFPKLWNVYVSGIGSSFGDGRQWMNWIHIKDVVNFFKASILDEKYQGIYNLVSPKNITNKDFHNILSEKTKSLSVAKIPKFTLNIFMGESANLITKGPFVEAKKLSKHGFVFEFSKFNDAMDSFLKERYHPKAHYYNVKQWVSAPIDKIWEFSSSADNLEKITPPWLNFKVKEMSTKNIMKNTRLKYSLSLRGVPLFWTTRIVDWNPTHSFTDNQDKGPYRLWFHQHIFKELAHGTLIEDRVEYLLPLFPFGQIAFALVKSDIYKIFQFSKKKIYEIFES